MNNSSEKWNWILVLTICSPYLVAFTLCLFKILFRKISSPTLFEFIIAMFFETASATGISICAFGIFPNLDLTRSILIINATSLLPALFKIITDTVTDLSSEDLKENDHDQKQSQNFRSRFFLSKFKLSKKKSTILFFGLNLISFIMQLSAIFVFIFSDYANSELKWKLPVAVVLVSVSLSFNHFFILAKTKNKFLNVLRSTKQKIEKSKHKIGLFSNIWKIGIVLLFSHIFYPNYLTNISLFQPSTATNQSINFWRQPLARSSPIAEENNLVYYIPFVVHFVASHVFYLSSSLAFKLRMIRLSFALPLTLITPIMFASSVLICEFGVKNGHDWLGSFNYDFLCEHVSMIKIYTICGLCLWWVSHLWTSIHIWQQPKSSSTTSTIKR